jgi:hypothetical protein
MSRIQIADLNSSEFGFMYDVNDAEMLAIIGGGWLKRFLKKAGKAIVKYGPTVISAIKLFLK